jgi:hypothetical protein
MPQLTRGVSVIVISTLCGAMPVAASTRAETPSMSARLAASLRPSKSEISTMR